MKAIISSGVQEDHPYIEDVLWNTAVLAKQEDPDIQLMGLHVQIRRHRRADIWAGQAWPMESTYSSRTRPHKIISHPAGKVTMTVGSEIAQGDIARLFAHELRHIGQFHRGRKLHGYLTGIEMCNGDAEEDCWEFEEVILSKFERARSNVHHAAFFTRRFQNKS